MKAIAGVFLAVILIGWLVVYQPFSSSSSESQFDPEDSPSLSSPDSGSATSDGAPSPSSKPADPLPDPEDPPPPPASSDRPASPATASPNSGSNVSAFRNEMLQLVNQIRAQGCKCGQKYMPPAPPLTWNQQLSRAALTQATDMDTYKFINHTGHDGSSISDRVSRTGYKWQAVGENLAWNVPTVKQAVLGWKNSPGHCENMMNQSFKEFGAAQKGPYMVQVFGRKMK